MIHLTWRALQVLRGQEADAELLTLCGQNPIKPYDARVLVQHREHYDREGRFLREAHVWTTTETRMVGGDAVTENFMRHELYAAVERVLSGNGFFSPEWEEDPLNPPNYFSALVIAPLGWCPDCESRMPNMLSAFSVAVDALLERNARMPKSAPFSKKQGERPIDLLVAWLRHVGPQPKHALQRFLWARAHPDDVDEEEVLDGDRLRIERASAGFWGTNWPGILDRGTLVRYENPSGGHPLYGAPE